MKVAEIFDYRNAKGILETVNEDVMKELFDIINNEKNILDIKTTEGSDRKISQQIQNYFVSKGWEKEKSMFTLPNLKYDLMKKNIPIEVEIGHERLVYAVFFKFLSDYSNGKIPAGIMIVTHNPNDFGKSWNNSLESTKRKIEAMSSVLLVPILVVGVKP